MKNYEPAIRLENIRKTFTIFEKQNDSIRNKFFNLGTPNHRRKIHALDGINLEVGRGEFLGIVGNNGSGKSTLLKLIMGSILPDKGGKIEVKGKIIRLALGMGFDPQLSALDNVYLNASLLGLSFKKIGEKFEEIIEFAELHDYVDTKLKFFSSGMQSRLAFSIAVHAEADILLMDEFFGGVGDVSFQRKSSEVFKSAFLSGRTIILVSHQLEQIKKYSDRVLFLDRGKMIAVGPPDEIVDMYKSKNI